MTIEIDVSCMEWWHWALAGLAAWYFAMAVFIRCVRDKDATADDRQGDMIIWATSPISIPFMLVVGAVWTFLWAFSLGIIPPPWKC